jgi:ParB-like chromosome segregation protein Spo0J
MNNININIKYVDINSLKPSEYNPRKWSELQKNHLKESISKFGNVDPIIANKYEGRENIVIGGHFRLETCKELGHTTIPVVYVSLPLEREKELNLRLNKNQGEFDYDLLAEFDENILAEIGFESEELDEIFSIEDTPESFDIEKELAKLEIGKIEARPGDVYELDGSRLMVGDSMNESDVLKLFDGHKA